MTSLTTASTLPTSPMAPGHVALPDPAHGFWARIANELANAIGQGVYPPGSRLPSEHRLAEQFGVNRHTIRRSIGSLCQLGLLRSSQGSGTYVEDLAVDLVLGKRTRHHHSLNKAGIRGGLHLVHANTLAADSSVASALQIAVGTQVLHLQVLGDGGGQALHFGDRYFPLPRFDGLQTLVADTGSISQAFEQLGVTDYTRSQSRISARMPSTEVAEHLGQPITRPVLHVSSVNVDDTGIPIEYARTWFAGDRVALTVRHGDVHE